MPPKENEDEQKQAEANAEETSQKPTDGSKESLDFANMDLSVESVEERISPSETNVFDK